MRRALPPAARRVVPPALVLPALALALAVAAAALLWADPAPARPPARWVRVSVATLWVRPAETRRVDAPACAVPADPRGWLEGLTGAQKRWLVGRLETQTLYGAKVYLLGRSGSWARVAVPGQPTPRNRWGYPGWVPARQLTATAPVAGTQTAILRRPVGWLFSGEDLTERVLELSYGTRLPVVSVTDDAVRVARPGGVSGWLRRSAVFIHDDGAEWPAPAGDEIVAEARRFLGLQYLWAGTSGFGYDCSGFTHAVYLALGVTIPRDAGDQRAAGTAVARDELRPGDLVFFRTASGAIHHVGMYAGNGRMIHSPRTGSPIATVSLTVQPYAGEYAGARRYIE